MPSSYITSSIQRVVMCHLIAAALLLSTHSRVSQAAPVADAESRVSEPDASETAAAIDKGKTKSADPELSQSKLKKILADISNFVVGPLTGQADVERVVAATHPVIVELTGGEERYREVLNGVYKEVRNAPQALTVKAFRYRQDPSIVKTPAGEYLVVAAEMLASPKNQDLDNLRVEVAFVGEKQADGRWCYVDVTNNAKKMLARVIPAFPSDYQLPECKTERVKRESP